MQKYKDFVVKGKDLEKIEKNAKDILQRLDKGASVGDVTGACSCLIREMNTKNRLFNALYGSFSALSFKTRKQVREFVSRFIDGFDYNFG